MAGRAGATIVEAARVTKTKTELMIVIVHFTTFDQFLGWLGSSAVFQLTWNSQLPRI